MKTIFKNKIISIQINSYSFKKNVSNDLLISPVPFFSITENPNSVYIGVTDFKNKNAFLAKLNINSFDSEHMIPIVRSGLLKTVQLFARWLKANKITKVQFTTVTKNEIISEVHKKILEAFRKYNLLA